MRSSTPTTAARQINATQMVLAASTDAPGGTRSPAAPAPPGGARKVLTVDELQSLEPGIDATDLAVGVYDEHAGYADPVATSLGFARAAEDQGAEGREGGG